MANTWYGEFPLHNSMDDGYEWTSPVGSFPPNAFGLYDLIGNVWEWTGDWYRDYLRAPACCGSHNPRGGNRDESCDPSTPEFRIPRRVIKGGSYLCAPNYCQRYRPAARRPQPVDTSTCHLGFRCVARGPAPGAIPSGRRESAMIRPARSARGKRARCALRKRSQSP